MEEVREFDSKLIAAKRRQNRDGMKRVEPQKQGKGKVAEC